LAVAAAGATVPAMAAPTFNEVERKILRGCTTASCHGPKGRAGGLELTYDRARKDLVGVPPLNEAARAAGLLRVAPGDPDRSFLLAKLTGPLAEGQGLPMPLVGPPLSANRIAVLRRWIAAGTPDVAAPRGRGLQPIVFRAAARPVSEGTEETTCHAATFPRDEATDVGRVKISFRGGSHQVHLYRSYNGRVDFPTKVCNFAVDFDKWQLITASQTNQLNWQLPPGVAINFGPRQPLLIQTHFVNTGELSTRRTPSAKIVLHPVDPASVTAHAGSLFAQDRTVVVPPGRSVAASRCLLAGQGPTARDLTIMAFTGHYHFRGVKFEVYRVRADGAVGELLYEDEGYAEPPFRQCPRDEPLVLRAGDGLEWRCTYENRDRVTYEFGPYTEENEHCNLFGFYYPTATPQEAIDCVHRVDEEGNEVDEVIVAR
jgi:hypothetical protein